MTTRRRFPGAALVGLVLVALAGCAAGGGQTSPGPASQALQQQVRACELAFAKTLADREFADFGGFVAEDAVFVNDGQPVHGRTAISAQWQTFYTGSAPFSWAPDPVVVLSSGGLAPSSGPVRAADGTVVARFHSTWRLDGDSVWRVVFASR